MAFKRSGVRIPSSPYALRILCCLFGLLSLVACQSEGALVQSEFSSLKRTPLLRRILKNNHRIPSFQANVSLSFRNKEQSLAADGKVWVDGDNQAFKLILTDTLTQEMVLFFLIQDHYLSFKSMEAPRMTHKLLSKKSFAKVLSKWTLGIHYFLALIQAKIPLIQKPELVTMQMENTQVLFKISKPPLVQILSIHQQTQRPDVLAFWDKGHKVLQIAYKKYLDFEDYFVPQRIDLTYRGSQVILFLSKFQTRPLFTNKVFEKPKT